ncbi:MULTISPECIES: hypothetical protein [unclassified Methylobacterium]|uniref:hypothetical protein n=1 Tax=unclassified Methylobacterium TaxID=2615210 RepID=UPI002269F5C0|nr:MULTISPECIES: hypothetical protein [unclassified Methylobacterium]
MADNQSGQTGGSSGASTGKSGGSSTGGSSSGSSGGGAGVADQAKETLRGATSRASDAWDNASEYGSRYYRQGSRAVTDMDSGTMTGLFIAGTVGFALGWLVFGQQSRSGDYIPNRMSRSSERY